MVKRLLVNDILTALPGHSTFWHTLRDWFSMDFVGGDYSTLATAASGVADGASLIIRNATWFGPMAASATVPTIVLLQDIITEPGPQREMQKAVMSTARAVVFNSDFTRKHYEKDVESITNAVFPLPVDFGVFHPGNAMGLQQALSLPNGAVLWVGASQGAAGHVKGFDFFWSIVRGNPDIPFVAVFKDAAPAAMPPNVRAYVGLTHADLVQVIGACSVGLCTSRMESQHLAGIEMGACGLPLVVPPVGIYWQRENMPGVIVADPTPAAYTAAIRTMRAQAFDHEAVREYWIPVAHPDVSQMQWTALIARAEAA